MKILLAIDGSAHSKAVIEEAWFLMQFITCKMFCIDCV